MSDNVIHNLFIDHVDKSSNDSGYHHHHGPNDIDYINHKHDYDPVDDDHKHDVVHDHGTECSVTGSVTYGPADHKHLADDDE